jgi:hypothetical protein
MTPPICADCEDAMATTLLDLGEIHAEMTGVREIPVCDSCWRSRDNEEPGEPDLSLSGPTVQEQQIAAMRMK